MARHVWGDESIHDMRIAQFPMHGHPKPFLTYRHCCVLFLGRGQAVGCRLLLGKHEKFEMGTRFTAITWAPPPQPSSSRRGDVNNKSIFTSGRVHHPVKVHSRTSQPSLRARAGTQRQDRFRRTPTSWTCWAPKRSNGQSRRKEMSVQLHQTQHHRSQCSRYFATPLTPPPQAPKGQFVAFSEIFSFFGGERLYRTRPCRDKPRQTNVTRRGKTPAGHKAT
jgi:hypothetical protein